MAVGRFKGAIEACRQFAEERNGVGPKSIADFTGDKRWKYLSNRWDSVPWKIDELADFIDVEPLQGPFVHLIPEVRFQFSELKSVPNDGEAAVPVETPPKTNVRKVVSKENRVVLAFELRPFVDDGKHWVLYTDGNCERVAIDS